MVSSDKITKLALELTELSTDETYGLMPRTPRVLAAIAHDHFEEHNGGVRPRSGGETTREWLVWARDSGEFDWAFTASPRSFSMTKTEWSRLSDTMKLEVGQRVLDSKKTRAR